MQQDYVCVSTYRQTLNAQLEQLRQEGCAKVFREKTSGAQADRRQLLRLLKGLARGDVVIVTRIDRLARWTFDLFAIVKEILAAGGQFSSLAEPWADTTTSTGRLMIAVFGGARGRGTRHDPHPHGGRPKPGDGARMGRPPNLPTCRKQRRRRRVEGATLQELADSYNVGRATISRLAV